MHLQHGVADLGDDSAVHGAVGRARDDLRGWKIGHFSKADTQSQSPLYTTPSITYTQMIHT